ncbi:hypothetical protein AM571_PB00468 (plasmid) [Rhizobium etli 8C-3]|uniref:Uncharacterized protein n=1 Tax=Rhizobium etli 8C-3 TaxID=538025 RepID=A0A1L5PCA5_RHIET|nr:hypothetical protein AM571_PB00468 [Rhizobium etli 8C-3]
MPPASNTSRGLPARSSMPSSSLRRCHVAFPHLPARTLLRAYRHIVQSFILRGAPVRTEQTNNPSRTEKDDGN